MAFNQAPINYAEQYGRALQTAYPYLSYYADLWNQGESERFRPLTGKTVMIPVMTTSGARAANRLRHVPSDSLFSFSALSHVCSGMATRKSLNYWLKAWIFGLDLQTLSVL